MFQFQIGGSGNHQVSITLAQSFPALLNRVEAILMQKTFACQEVKDAYQTLISEINLHLNENKEHTFTKSKYIVFPFKTLPEDEYLNDLYFIQGLIEALTIISFSNHTFEIRHDYINININNKNFFGIYYQSGNFNLVDNYTRLLKSMVDKKAIIPPEFVCIILNTTETELEEEKMSNIVTNIMGDSSYIKQKATDKPKCIGLTSYLIENAQSLEEAKQLIKGVLKLEN